VSDAHNNPIAYVLTDRIVQISPSDLL